MSEERIALLIDSDNISAKYIAYILDEISKYGIVTYKRIYGDWTSTQNTTWKGELLENSINPIQQFSNTAGKNATDSAMIIDAMDILYTNNVDGFCIVSSDSDFTKLASRLRESGMLVIGMGEEKTPKSFRAACSKFTSLNVLLDTGDQDENIDKGVIESAIVDIISENANQGKGTGLGEIGSRLVKQYPEFDARNYGYSLLSKFLEEFDALKLVKKNSTIIVALADNGTLKQELNDYVMELVKVAGKKGISLGELSNRIHHKYKNFNVKDYGYSTFSKYVQGIVEVKIEKDKGNQPIVFKK